MYNETCNGAILSMVNNLDICGKTMKDTLALMGKTFDGLNAIDEKLIDVDEWMQDIAETHDRADAEHDERIYELTKRRASLRAELADTREELAKALKLLDDHGVPIPTDGHLIDISELMSPFFKSLARMAITNNDDCLEEENDILFGDERNLPF